MTSLIQGAQLFKLVLSDTQQQMFDVYRRELITWNEKVNLTRITAPEEITVKHFLDSLSLYPLLADFSADFSLIDVGTGAGFPGLPLKIALPDMQLSLLESTRKKTTFLHHIVGTLNLTNVTIVTARAEEAGRQPAHRQQYDVAVARAVAALPTLAEYTLPLVKVGGMVIVQKGQDPNEEVKSAANALGILGGKIEQILPVDVPGLDAERHLIVIRKRKPTPKQYPRRPGLPAKKPI